MNALSRIYACNIGAFVESGQAFDIRSCRRRSAVEGRGWRMPGTITVHAKMKRNHHSYYCYSATSKYE
eukprot:scaffold224_cov276-Chaetoceros_neogracile.AAC.56